MIYVSCGHLNGIGLEIFLKSYLLLTKKEKQFFTLVVGKDSFETYLKDCTIPIAHFNQLQIIYIQKSKEPESTVSLLKILHQINADDILITLPTSKDQLILNNQNQAGYTEFFRSYFNNQNISMFFKSYRENVLLISDHIPLKNVPIYVSNNLINDKIQTAIDGYNHYFAHVDGPLEEILISGINPHAGENGILGSEELSLNFKSFKNSKIIGPLPGDTLHVHKNLSKNQLFVYMYHDQGLASFKARNLFTGLNISFGLPFLRLSVDHGTAFNLYGKNKASLTGMMYLLITALEVHSNGNQRN